MFRVFPLIAATVCLKNGMDFLECTADVLPVAYNTVGLFTLFRLRVFTGSY